MPQGPGGYAAILLAIDINGEIVKRRVIADGEPMTTNNRMELMAAIVALEVLDRPSTVVMHSDSRYVVDAFTEQWVTSWKRKSFHKIKNVDLWHRLIAQDERHAVQWRWVKGHSGIEFNEEADLLAAEQTRLQLAALEIG